MTVDPALLRALRQSVGADPENVPARLHLAQVLLDADQPDDALDEVAGVLAVQPANLEAFALGARAAEQAGLPDRAVAYRRVLAALGGRSVEPGPPVPALPPLWRADGRGARIAAPRAGIGRDRGDDLGDDRTGRADGPPGLDDDVVDLGKLDGLAARAGPGRDRPDRLPDRFGGGRGDGLDVPALPIGVEGQADAADLAEDDAAGLAHDLGWVVEDLERPVTFDDVIGLDHARRRLEAVLVPLRHPDLAARVHRTPVGGVLLYGPAGCGKTFLTRAVAGELGRPRLAAELLEILDGSVEGCARLRAVFEAARAAAPCVLVLDDVDALRAESHEVVVQFLVELDRVQRDDDVLVLATSRVPWDVDPALRRTGRFDRAVLVPPPDRDARSAILAHHLLDWPVRDVAVDRLAEALDGYSFADLWSIAETAAERALERAYATQSPWEVTGEELERVAAETRPSTRSWLELAHGSVARAGGALSVYGDLLAYLRAHPA
jgi:AAA+ superfamily predicted ATPase